MSFPENDGGNGEDLLRQDTTIERGASDIASLGEKVGESVDAQIGSGKTEEGVPPKETEAEILQRLIAGQWYS